MQNSQGKVPDSVLQNLSNRGSNLIAALQALTQSISVLPELRPRNNQKSSGRKKTKKGATHKVGSHFKPRFLFHKDGVPVTPAMYRRLHMGMKSPRKNGHKSIN